LHRRTTINLEQGAKHDGRPPLQTEAWLNKHQHYSAGGEPLHTDLTLAMKRVAADLRAIHDRVAKLEKGEPK
jgi:hypothetical protein